MKQVLMVTVLVSLFSLSLPAQSRTSLQTRVEANVVYGMYSGLALLMDVHYPERANGYGVLFIPGSGWHASLSYRARQLKDSIRGFHAEFFRSLLNAGYTVFVINHRAAPRFRYPAAVDDAQRAVRFIRHDAQRFRISADRIGGFGYSSGAHVIAMVGVLDGKGNNVDADPVNRERAKLQSVVASATPGDLLVPLSSTSTAAVASFMGLVVPPWEDQASQEYRTYEDASPVHHVTSDDAPLLLIHGDADEEVPFQQAMLLDEAARQAGVPVRLVRIPGGNHGDLRKPGAPDYLGEMVRWHDQHLRGVR